MPLLVNCVPAGEYLGEGFHRAGGVPAVLHELAVAGRLHADCPTVSGQTIGDIAAAARTRDTEVIRSCDAPLKHRAGFIVLSGNFFDSAIIKMSVVGDTFRRAYLSEPGSENAFEARAIVFEGPEDYHARIEDPALHIDEHCILVIRGAGNVGYPGSAEVVNMAPPSYLLKRGIDSLPCLGDGRQSGTSASPSILNMSPEAAVGGGLALLRTGDRIRVDLNQRTITALVDETEMESRRQAPPYQPPESQTPWQELYRQLVGQLSTGGCLEPATLYLRVVETRGDPRHSH
ncbi:L-arabonate dehydratase [compost metagenome]